MHAGLTQEERDTLTAEFNDPESSLQVLIIMYDVSGSEVNLHEASQIAYVASPARHAALEI